MRRVVRADCTDKAPRGFNVVSSVTKEYQIEDYCDRKNPRSSHDPAERVAALFYTCEFAQFFVRDCARFDEAFAIVDAIVTFIVHDLVANGGDVAQTADEGVGQLPFDAADFLVKAASGGFQMLLQKRFEFLGVGYDQFNIAHGGKFNALANRLHEA